MLQYCVSTTIALVLCIYPVLVTAEESVNDVTRAVTRNYERFHALENLYVHFTLKYEHLHGKRQFAFRMMDVKTYRKGEKLRVAVVATRHDDSKLSREYAWNGKIGTGNERDSRAANPNFTMNPIPEYNLFFYNYFVDFMSYPDGSGSAPAVAYPENRASIWLPRAISDDPTRYNLSTRVDEAGIECQVLEHPKHEGFWFDPKSGYALRRHDSFHPATGDRKETTILREFRKVADVWLPGSIVREEFGGADDPTSRPGVSRARKTITLIDISTTEIADVTFKLKAPKGVTVHDVVNRSFFIEYGDGVNPILSAAEKARKEVKPSGRWRLILLTANILGAVIILVVIIVRRKSSAGNS